MTILTKGTAAFYDRNITQMAGLRREAERLQQQITTGERLEVSSDDPVAASRLRNLSRQDRLAAVDGANAQRAGNALREADAALAGMANDLIRARELTVQAANGTLSPAQRRLIGEELSQLHSSLIASANSRGSDTRPLFAGQTDGLAYLVDAAGNTAYSGTAGAGEITLGEGISVKRGVTGPEVFAFTHEGTVTDTLSFLKGLADALKGAAADPAAAVAAAGAALGGFDGALDSLNRAQTIIGVRAAWVETVQDRQNVTSLARAQEATHTGGVDLATTITQLQQMLTVLEASQASFVRIGQLSLFNTI